MADGKGTQCAMLPVRRAGRHHPARCYEFAVAPALSRLQSLDRPNASPSSRSAAMAAARWRPAPTSISCSSCPTSRPAGARASSNSCSMRCGIRASRSATPRAASMSASGLRNPTTPSSPPFSKRASSAATRRSSTTLAQRFRKEIVAGGRQGLHRQQARRARRAPSQVRRKPLSGRARCQGRQGRLARSPHAVLDRQDSSTAPIRPKNSPSKGVFTRDELAAFREERGFPVGGALPSAFHHRAAARTA